MYLVWDFGFVGSVVMQKRKKTDRAVGSWEKSISEPTLINWFAPDFTFCGCDTFPSFTDTTDTASETLRKLVSYLCARSDSLAI